MSQPKSKSVLLVNEIVKNRQRRNSASSSLQITVPKFKDFESDKKLRFLIEFGAGAMGGAISRTLTAPIDRLRTVYQVESVDKKRGDLSLKSVWRCMLKEGKLRGLWRGNFVNVVKTAPESAVRFATYEKFKQLLNKDKCEITFNEKILCGGAASFVSASILYPLKTVKTLMNLGHTGEYQSIFDCVAKTYKKHGFISFYRGLLANSVAIIPSAGIDLATYETLKKMYSKATNKNEPNVMEKMILGNFSSCLGNLIVYPLLFARTRLQSNRNASETTCSLLLKVWKNDGLSGVYRGFFLHILKIGPAASISYITFESITKSFRIDSLN
ncbi:unnamed protein product [Brachionus calyciflorus]|uniref:Uncharacterized protein n=1 Tax=Brachionus calyciflorus TaxID=104777 RepID=A0A814D6L2_9BILA|nr:unnamed protein product [Brachionus calyciflorus]